jgi:hypothetical protein
MLGGRVTVTERFSGFARTSQAGAW